ncbi:uncharacterized protein K02A2.6-like [Asterias rubens]|uniref:uncharacterized protein K02A2.6-like n=1 Tax=Asterias rubens TaxID=7604 RepID=UPI00145502F7|nr:uncharacterized protein K02A2.6-like [Asterias rubens]
MATSSSIDHVAKPKGQPRTKQYTLEHDSKPRSCRWCGRTSHPRRDCPAKDAVCDTCSKPGHFKSACLSGNASKRNTTKVHEVQDFFDDDLPFLGEVTSNSDYWSAFITVDGNRTCFKLDTGATVSVISDTEPWLANVQLQETTQLLRGPGGTPLPVKGMLTATLQYSERKITERLYVIQNQRCSLLSKRACVNLGLIKRVNEVKQISTPDFRAEFPGLFTGLGKLQTPYHITLCPDTKPVCLYTPRKVPHPLLPQVEKEIQSMLKQGVISPVTSPTTWCSGLVVIPKSNGKHRICVDLTNLNKSVLREIHPMSSVDESLAKLGRSTIFSKLDAKSGFWQIPLDAESTLLTTFIAPSGRYCFNRLPFGISSAPEIFQRAMSQVLVDLNGVICHMDDILIHGATQLEHDARVRAVLQRLHNAGLTLNEKCEFSKHSIKFLGHVIDTAGIHADKGKTTAIAEYPVPSNITELQRFMGMVNQLGKFVPGLAEINEPLRQLLRKDTIWYWGEAQQSSFQRVKDLLLSSAVLAHYEPSRPTFVATDASSSGIGAVLLQTQDNGKRHPICYASRSLSDTEKRYAVIEKEALAATWGCEKFSDYVLGLHFTLETDHKPLVSLLQTKELSKMPPRILRFRLRLMRFSPTVEYVPGKLQTTADALSRAPVGTPDETDTALISEIEHFTNHVLTSLPATSQRLLEIVAAQKSDEECTQIKEFCIGGWPVYMPHTPLLRQYWENRSHLSILDDLLLYDDRIVIPRSMRLDILDRIHQGHLGITKCRARARTSVWWPGLSKSIEDMISNCVTCAKHRPEQREPLMPASFPSRPWERLGADLFEYRGKIYLIVIDYYSRWIEIKSLPSVQTSAAVIQALKEIFAVHGIPDVIMSDNGPQFSSASFLQFAKTYGFIHTTSSPRYPQANGEAERAVRTIKGLLKKNTDPYLALLMYRSSPLQNGLSPSELLMGRKLKTTLPILPSNLHPKAQQDQTIRQKEEAYRTKQQHNFNLRHRATTLPTLHPGDSVWIRDQNRQGTILAKSSQPRSYIVETNLGTVRRNRSALVTTPDHTPQPPDPDALLSPPSDVTTQTILPTNMQQFPPSTSPEKQSPSLSPPPSTPPPAVMTNPIRTFSEAALPP